MNPDNKKRTKRRTLAATKSYAYFFPTSIGLTLLVVAIAIAGFFCVSMAGCAESETNEVLVSDVESELDGNFKIHNVLETACEGNDCVVYETPGENEYYGMQCQVTLADSYFDFNARAGAFAGLPEIGHSVVDLGYEWDCGDAGSWSDPRRFGGTYLWFVEDDLMILDLVRGDGLRFDGTLEGDELVLVNSEDLWGYYLYTIQLSETRRECPEGLGRCYTRADCSGEPMLKCCSQEACEVTATEYYWPEGKGSWENGGTCAEVEHDCSS